MNIQLIYIDHIHCIFVINNHQWEVATNASIPIVFTSVVAAIEDALPFKVNVSITMIVDLQLELSLASSSLLSSLLSLLYSSVGGIGAGINAHLHHLRHTYSLNQHPQYGTSKLMCRETSIRQTPITQTQT